MRIKIRKSLKSDIESLISIYKKCFPEDLSPQLPFKYKIISPDTCFVALYDNQVVAMLSAIPIKYGNDKGHQLFALATDPLYQKLGIATLLFNEVDKILKNVGSKFSILIPATESLYSYYKKQGYTNIPAKTITLMPQEKLHYPFKQIKYPNKFKTYCLNSAIQNNEEATYKGNLICGTPKDKEVVVYDYMPNSQGFIINKSKKTYSFRLPCNSSNEYFGMIKNFDNSIREGIFPLLSNL